MHETRKGGASWLCLFGIGIKYQQRWRHPTSLLQPLKQTGTEYRPAYPFEGEDPAAASDAQEDVQRAALSPGHHVGGGLAHEVHDGEPTQQFHHLGHSLLRAVAKKTQKEDTVD